MIRTALVLLVVSLPIAAHARPSPYPPVTQYDGDRVSAQAPPVVRQTGAAKGMTHGASRVIGGRPAGCPSRFCGCGASLHLFGRIIPALNLAANWLRFPRAEPAPKMAAARHGHVFVLERHIRGPVWLVFDANSGGHRTRVHPRSIAGFRIVNPHERG